MRFAYGARTIIDDLSFEVARGEVLALMGGSGVGKTTLLRLMAGLVRPSRGQVRVFGRVVQTQDRAALYEIRRRMGLLFQFGALFTD